MLLPLLPIALQGCNGPAVRVSDLVEPREEDRRALAAADSIEVAAAGEDPDAISAARLAAEALVARGWATTRVTRRRAGTVPLVVVDAQRTEESPGIAGRVAVFRPGREGPVFARVFWAPGAVDEGLELAIASALARVPAPKRPSPAREGD